MLGWARRLKSKLKLRQTSPSLSQYSLAQYKEFARTVQTMSFFPPTVTFPEVSPYFSQSTVPSLWTPSPSPAGLTQNTQGSKEGKARQAGTAGGSPKPALRSLQLPEWEGWTPVLSQSPCQGQGRVYAVLGPGQSSSENILGMY